jgi:ligand-binding SRPBCC domain-containing protein
VVKIEEKTLFNLPIHAVFDAERDISLHASTQKHRGEKAVGGVTSGLIECGQEVEWEAVHFGIRQRLRTRITHMEKPGYFRDEMVSGAFKSFCHEHFFREAGDGITEKRDVVLIAAPLGPLGRAAEALFLGRYMRNLIVKKNRELKRMIEKSAPDEPLREVDRQ